MDVVSSVCPVEWTVTSRAREGAISSLLCQAVLSSGSSHQGTSVVGQVSLQKSFTLDFSKLNGFPERLAGLLPPTVGEANRFPYMVYLQKVVAYVNQALDSLYAKLIVF